MAPPSSPSRSTGSVATAIRAGIATSAGDFIVSLVNLGHDAALALAYSITSTVDAFFLAPMVPIFMATATTGSHRSTVVPILERIIHEKGKDGVSSPEK